jgi:hypothetical protein
MVLGLTDSAPYAGGRPTHAQFEGIIVSTFFWETMQAAANVETDLAKPGTGTSANSISMVAIVKLRTGQAWRVCVRFPLLDVFRTLQG